MWAFKKLCRREGQKMVTGPVGKFFRTRHELVSLRHAFSTEEPLPQGGKNWFWADEGLSHYNGLWTSKGQQYVSQMYCGSLY